MANGQYTKQFLDLDVGIPEGATKIELGEVAEEVACYPWGASLNVQSRNKFVYCVLTKEDIHYGRKLKFSERQGEQICFAPKANPVGIKICKSLSGMKTPSGGWGIYEEYEW